MANTLGNYSPLFYANEALALLRKNLGLAARVYRGYDRERRTFDRGEIITIRKPSTFQAYDAPSSEQDILPGNVDIRLDQWKEVKIALTDKERAFTSNEIINEHIAPMAYALADGLDTSLARLYRDIPYVYDYGSATDHTILTGARKILVDNYVPLNDGKLHAMVDSTLEAAFLNASTVLIGTAPNATENALLRGSLGNRYGVEIFVNQNTQLHTPGTATQAAGDKAGAINMAAGLAKGATSVVVNNFTGSETLKAGDTFIIAGNTQRYAVTTDVTMSGGAGTIAFWPVAVQAYANASVITLGTAPSDTAHTANIMFHENAFALVMAQLPMDMPGIEAFTANDPVTGISLRARRFADGNNSKLYMALDVLYGVRTLDPNLAVRFST